PAASAYYLTLERELRSAELVALGGAAAYAALEAGTVHAFAFGRPDLVSEVAQRPGLRVVEGRFMVSELAVAVPKGRPAALAFVTEVVELAKASGLVQQVIARAGLVGVQAAPPTRGVRLPATGAPAVPASARAPAAAALLLLGTGLAATGLRRRTQRRRPVAASV
ncbi:MAG TPA: transporter substrate-binding domain-containing protein, partial [Chloroflexota bacterium]|nr:transporter substrate-binding domain-containing protein [Chloroflexota bacterium]